MNTTRQTSNRNARVILSAAIAAATLGLFASGSQAAVRPGEHVAQHVVRYADLNLGSRAGVDQLYQRIVAAAHSVCGTDQAFSLTAQVDSRQCSERAIARAVATIDNPALSNRYRDSVGNGAAAPELPVAP